MALAERPKSCDLADHSITARQNKTYDDTVADLGYMLYIVAGNVGLR